jgi:hypothetical protein
MHFSAGQHGGDLNTDTIPIVGATLDLQEKDVRQASAPLVNCPSISVRLLQRVQAMTPINDVFMLSIDSKLDYETLREICATGHSRVPVYEEVEVPTSGVIEARDKAGSAIAALPSPDGKEGRQKHDDGQEDHRMSRNRLVILASILATIISSSSVFSSILVVYPKTRIGNI